VETNSRWSSSGWKIEILAVALLTLLALGLRLFHIGAWSFWPDEVFSFGLKSDGFNDSLLRRSLATDLIRLAVEWLGRSEWSARLVPALVGVAAVPLLYLLLRRCMARPGALAAAFLLALSPWHIYWSQNARFYTLLFLFFNLGLLLFYLGIERNRPWLLLAALVLFGMAARERFAALLGMPALALYLVLVALLPFGKPRGLTLRNLAVFFGPAVLAGLILLLPFLRNLDGWFAGFGRLNNTPFFLLAGTTYYIGAPLAAFAGLSALLALRAKNRLALLLILSGVTPLVLLMGISLVQYTANRYIFFSLFSWLALAGVGLQMLLDRLPASAKGYAGLAAVALVTAYAGDLFLYYTVQNGNRDDWRGAFAYIEANALEGDWVVASDEDIAHYYLEDASLHIRHWGAAEQPEGARVWYVEDMTVAELYPEQLAEATAAARPMADFDVRLPGRTYRMRIYLEGGT
jgi:4-amino-4-deoxy-L-arabinose transferase-like glycosyltransferase